MLLAWDTPTNTLSAGWARYTLERRFGVGVTAVRTSSLGRANFNDYDVIVLPSGNYAGQINEAVLNRIKDWLRAGGTVVTIAEATRWATGANVGLLETTGLLKDGRPDVPPASGSGASGASGASGVHRVHECAGAKPVEFDYDKAIQPDRERPASQPGAILRVTLDTNHWLTAGNDGETQVMIEGNRVFAPLKLNNGRNVGVYAAKDKLIASGLIWPDAPGHPRAEGLPDAPALRPGPRHCVCRGAELSCVHRVDDAAVHERGDARSGLLMTECHGGTETRRLFFEIRRGVKHETGI